MLQKFETSKGLLYYFFSHAVCVKCSADIEPKDLVALIDFKQIEVSQSRQREVNPDLIFDQKKYQLLVLKADEWLIIADNWYYTLYHATRSDPRLKSIYKQFEVFTFTFSDSDSSYDFLYAIHGEVLRKVVIIDPHYKGGEISENLGHPFPVEQVFDPKQSDHEVIIPIAYYLGIDFTKIKASEVECYEYVI